MSTESGIPDFRSSTGFWRNIDPRRVATVEAMEKDPDLFRRFYGERLRNLERSFPTRVITCWPSGRNRGSSGRWSPKTWTDCTTRREVPEVYELHGTLRTARCHRWEAPADLEDFLEGRTCGCAAVPSVPMSCCSANCCRKRYADRGIEAIRESSLLLVIGAGLEVYPVNQLPMLARDERRSSTGAKPNGTTGFTR